MIKVYTNNYFCEGDNIRLGQPSLAGLYPYAAAVRKVSAKNNKQF